MIQCEICLHFQASPIARSYKLEKEIHGRCLIINNERYNDGRIRNGSNNDVKILSRLFRQLGLIVEVRKNLNYRQMDDELRRFSRAQYQEEAEMAVVIVMAHGVEGRISIDRF